MIILHVEEHSPIGYADVDKSILIPQTGDLPLRNKAGKCFFDYINENKEPIIGNFREYYGARATNAHLSRSFPAVEVYPFFMVWIKERSEWVGVKFHYQGCDQDLDGFNEFVDTAGPYRLDQRCSELIKKAYKIETTQELSRLSPQILEKLALNTNQDK